MARPEAETLEDLEFLYDTGAGALEAAHRAGFPTVDALEKWLRAHHGKDLYARLAARDTSVRTETEFDRTIFYTRRRCAS